MDIKEKLEKLVKFMEENNLCELEIEEEGRKIKLKKYDPTISPLPQEIHLERKESVTQQQKEKKENLVELKSPMVGTFYRAPSPGAKPFVEERDTINPGDVVCIIEAMKLMNEIKAEIKGEIVKILVENGEPVEFGQPLFLIKPLP
ncbi:MAG: acetyl-CoA carboxylase, biotin carboxyl carrier protein [Candidatus Omnitrophica bacterium 4484_70.1]|nr:MAG: acetyl-CoA carboxylase, biotin carboxyl carrier protein [Candidatus Omnitrophica bacterium 4484_70.1]